MNQTTADKISAYKDRIWKIHKDRASYSFTIPMLDEAYQLALRVLECNSSDPHQVAQMTGINWQTVKQVWKALE